MLLLSSLILTSWEMVIFMVKRNSLLKLFFLVSLGFCTYHTTAQNLEDIIVTITFESNPTDYTATTAPLKYNKKFALSMQVDDGNSSIFDIGFQVFEGGSVDGTTAIGMNYSDGCSNLISFKMTSAIFMFSGGNPIPSGTDVHNNPESDVITWPQLDILFNSGWGIANKGINSYIGDNTDFINYSIARNKSYCRRKMYNATPGGVITNVFVNPGGNLNWSFPAFNLGNICAINQISLTPLGIYGGNVNEPTINWAENKYNLYRITARDNDVKAFADSLANSSVDGANYWGSLFTTSLVDNYPSSDFVNDFNYIFNKYGSAGSDEILMATDEEILDYLIVRDAIEINKNLSGNNLILTFSGDPPDNLLNYASTLIVSSEANIIDINIEGAESFSECVINDTAALINFSWDGYFIPPPEDLASFYTATAVSTETDYDALIAMDYVTVLDYGDIKYDLVTQLCAISGVEYDEGFCNSGYPDFVKITGDSIISYGEETVLTATDFMESYIWSNGQTTEAITVSPVSDTKYWVDAVTKFGNNVSDSITVVVSDSYIISHSPLFIDHIKGQTDSLWVELKAGATSLWSTASTENFILVDPEVSTTYHLDVIVNSEIVNQLDFDVYVGNVIDFSFDSVCFGQITTLMNTSVVNDSIAKVFWDLNGDTQFNDAEGDTVTYMFNNIGDHLVGMRVYFKTDPMEVTYNVVPVGDTPVVDFDYANSCLGSTTIFYGEAAVQVGVIDQWLWNFGDGKTDSFQNTSNLYADAGSFDVMLTAWSSAGCKDSLQKSVTIFNDPIVELRTANDIIVNNLDTVFFSKGGSTTLHVSNFASYDSVIWYDDSNAESITITEEGSYNVTVYQEDCNTTQRFFTSWGSSPQPSGNDIMNLITPNGDGYNDIWIVSDPEINFPIKVNIYNRNGKQVYTNNNYQNDWDGQYNGNPLPQATYYYVIEDSSGNTVKGPVTIIR